MSYVMEGEIAKFSKVKRQLILYTVRIDVTLSDQLFAKFIGQEVRLCGFTVPIWLGPDSLQYPNSDVVGIYKYICDYSVR